MNVTLSPALAKYVETRVKTGLYESPGEVVREGLRLLLEREVLAVEEQLLESEQAKESPLTKRDWQELRRRVRGTSK